MADPLSVAGLAAGLVSLGLQTCGGIRKYLDALDCREQDIASIKQQNSALWNTIQVVESSLAQLQRDHHRPTAAVRACLDSCKNDLKALDDLVAQLATGFGQSTPSRRNKIKAHGNKLLYPFSRPKLEQLETRVRNANVTLQPALQALGISVSQSGTERLASLVSTSLLGVQSEVSAINTPLLGIQNSLSGLDTRLENLESLIAVAAQLLAHKPVVDGKPQEITTKVATRRLLEKPAMLREICDAMGDRTTSLSTSAMMMASTSRDSSQFSKTISAYLETNAVCLCRTRQPFQRKNVIWGSFALFSETKTEQHEPSCPAGQIRGADQSRKFSLRYTGLQSLLKSAVQISFAMRSGAGAWSLSPNFTYYPTVDEESAPAFRMINVLLGAAFTFLLATQEPSAILRWEELAGSVLTKILTLFRTGKASPLAVDANNQSLLHHLARMIRNSTYTPLSDDVDAQYGDLMKPLLDVSRILIKSKVPVNDYDILGDTPFSKMMKWAHYAPSLPAASEFILQSGGDLDLDFIAQSGQPLYVVPATTTRLSSAQNTVKEVLQFLSSSSTVAEAYGCGPLSLAILANDHAKVEYFVEHHPATLTERNLFGQSPLHLAADKPAYLRLITRAADDRLLNETDNAGISPFEAALLLSGSRCRKDLSRRRCRRCQCAECPVIILKADCALPLGNSRVSLQELLDRSSQRCRLRYIRNIKDRRDRLKQLALDNLSTAESEQLGLRAEAVLDSHAPQVVLLLQQRGVHIPASLDVTPFASRSTKAWEESPSSVYQLLRKPLDAELFFQLGFRDTDNWLKKDAREAPMLPMYYIEWLDNHGSDALFRQLWSSNNGTAHGFFTAYCTFYAIGNELCEPYWYECSTGTPYKLGRTSREWIEGLNVALLRPGLANSCRCKCSIESCTPLTFFLKGVIHLLNDSWFSRIQDMELGRAVHSFCRFLDLFGAHLDVRHHMASVRFLTFTALEIPHTCCQPKRSSRAWHSMKEKVEEIHDEDDYQLVLLEELLEEFESEVVEVLQNNDRDCAALKDFWKCTWFDRLCEVRARLRGDDLSDDERRRAEEIGVVWDQEAPAETTKGSNPFKRGTIDYWFYELEQIEAECLRD